MRGKIVWALIFILIGILIVLSNVNMGFVLNFWYGLLAIFALSDLIGNRRINFLNVGLFAVGIFLILADNIPSLTVYCNFSYLAALIFILIGLNLLIGNRGKHPVWRKNISNKEDGTHFEISAVFSGRKERYDGFNYSSGTAVAVFGSAELDLTGIEVNPEGLYLDVTAVFGGIEIYVPQQWRVDKSACLGVFGGVSVKNDLGNDKNTVLYLRGQAIFAGVEIIYK